MVVATPKPLLILISAPSGAGKTTLCEQLLANHPEITRAVTCTTRAPRAGERNGVDYHFLSRAEFEQRLQAGEFLEHANVYGNLYGTLKTEVLERLRTGKHVLLNIDVQGAATVRQQAKSHAELGAALISVFLTPDSFSILEQRLRKRGTDSEEVIQRRLLTARLELEQYRNFDYLLISTSIGEDLRRMQTILEAERMRESRSIPPRFD